jgi:hypothetical protein
MNDNYGNMNNGGVPPVQNNPGMVQQPMQQPIQQPVMNQDGFGQPIYVPPKKPVSVGKIVLVVILVIVCLAVVYNYVLIKTMKCDVSQEFGDVKVDMTVVYKKRLDKPYSMKRSVTVDLSNYDEEAGGMTKKDAFKLFGYEDEEDPCEDYGSGCSFHSSEVGDKKTLSITIKGKALEKYMEDEDVKESDFVDFDNIKKNIEELGEDATCK